ncbi:MAG: hypothetical protein IJ960_06755 [Oscillospiraceae bacterium]|nr:hypothetical protein [Oscillospiraceae bacterium]
MWPRLVPPRVCRTSCTVILTDGVGEDGAPVTVAELTLNCNWQDKPRQVLNPERQLIQLGGTALFDGDIAPALDVLSGTVKIYGREWTIYRGTKCRNPDGSVNYTRLELM